mgnify:CR=1 FL=1
MLVDNDDRTGGDLIGLSLGLYHVVARLLCQALALADAVQVAIDFAKEHPDETLILVTGDHETGGLTIGFAGTDYDTYLSLLDSQKISFAKFDSDYVAAYKENKTDFNTVLAGPVWL